MHPEFEHIAAQFEPTVGAIARQVKASLPPHCCVTFNDLKECGRVGLWLAWQRYDAERADTFTGYARLRIRGAMLDELRKLDPLTKTKRKQAKRIRDTRNLLRQQLQREPTAAEIVELAGVTLEAIESAQPTHVELAEALHLPDDQPQPDESAITRQQLVRMRAAFSVLSQRQRQALELLFFSGWTYEQVAVELSTTVSTVSTIRAAALNKLRTRMANG